MVREVIYPSVPTSRAVVSTIGFLRRTKDARIKKALESSCRQRLQEVGNDRVLICWTRELQIAIVE